MKLHTDTFSRLTLGLMDQANCSPEKAQQKLESLSLNLICGEEITRSVPLQAALLTAVNTAKRAFLGGVFVYLAKQTPALLPWPEKKTLNEIVQELGGSLVNETTSDNFSLTFGRPCEDLNGLQVVCNNWQAGVLVENTDLPFSCTGSIPTAGIFAGSYGVFLAFLKEAGIHIAACDDSKGISLWRPDLNWLEIEAAGPKIELLPQKYWLLGLGHLGQAYLWNIGLLPYQNPAQVLFMLQDYDKIVRANWSAGLLTEFVNIGFYKTRLCSSWLEERGFQTRLTERRFDENTRREGEEPFVALCGFDNASSRLPLEGAGFDLVLESGLGHNISTFDIIAQHSFPGGSKTPHELWGDMDETNVEVNENVYELLKELDEGECGILPLTLAGKAVSASFVGACSGALMIAELLRGLHGGKRYDKITLQLRQLDNCKAIIHNQEYYSTELSRNGFTGLKPILV